MLAGSIALGTPPLGEATHVARHTHPAPSEAQGESRREGLGRLVGPLALGRRNGRRNRDLPPHGRRIAARIGIGVAVAILIVSAGGPSSAAAAMSMRQRPRWIPSPAN